MEGRPPNVIKYKCKTYAIPSLQIPQDLKIIETEVCCVLAVFTCFLRHLAIGNQIADEMDLLSCQLQPLIFLLFTLNKTKKEYLHFFSCFTVYL